MVPPKKNIHKIQLVYACQFVSLSKLSLDQFLDANILQKCNIISYKPFRTLIYA